MSEILKPLTGEDRIARIRDIRARKGHLLGCGVAFSITRGEDGLDEYSVNDLKYSVPSRGYFGETVYVYRGVPEKSIRQRHARQSEFVEAGRPLAQMEEAAQQRLGRQQLVGRYAEALYARPVGSRHDPHVESFEREICMLRTATTFEEQREASLLAVLHGIQVGTFDDDKVAGKSYTNFSPCTMRGDISAYYRAVDAINAAGGHYSDGMGM